MEKENHYVSISCGSRDVPQDGLPGSLDFMAFMRQGTKNSFSPHGFLLFAVWIGEVCGVFEWKVTKADVF